MMYNTVPTGWCSHHWVTENITCFLNLLQNTCLFWVILKMIKYMDHYYGMIVKFLVYFNLFILAILVIVLRVLSFFGRHMPPELQKQSFLYLLFLK
jgi:hypothetical protein